MKGTIGLIGIVLVVVFGVFIITSVEPPMSDASYRVLTQGALEVTKMHEDFSASEASKQDPCLYQLRREIALYLETFDNQSVLFHEAAKCNRYLSGLVEKSVKNDDFITLRMILGW